MDYEESEAVERLAALIRDVYNDRKYAAAGYTQRRTERSLQADQKLARVRGEAYVSCYTGKSVPKRQQGPACRSNCRYKCSERIGSEDRAVVFREFWSLPDRQMQWDYVAGRLIVKPKSQATTEDRVVVSRRNNSRVYHLHVDGLAKRVCKTMFLNTLGISNCWLQTVCNKLERHGYVSDDQRGKHGRRKRGVVGS